MPHTQEVKSNQSAVVKSSLHVMPAECVALIMLGHCDIASPTSEVGCPHNQFVFGYKAPNEKEFVRLKLKV